MKRFSLFFSALLFLCIAGQAQDHNMGASSAHIMAHGHKLNWKTGPASLPPGSKMAVLEGDLSKEGPFTIRLMLPANYQVKPHWHPAIEHVTVLQGAFYMGTGDIFKSATATKLGVGDFAVMPVKYTHFAFTKGKTIIQLHGMGPWGITYVNPADDPRKK